MGNFEWMAAFTLICLSLFIFVLPGAICLALIQDGKMGPLPLNAEGSPDSLQTYSHMIKELLPVGMRGVMVAALLAALMFAFLVFFYY